MNCFSVINSTCEETPSCYDIDSCPPHPHSWHACLVNCFIFPSSLCLNVPFSSYTRTEDGSYPRQKRSRICTSRNEVLMIVGLMSLWDSHSLPPVPRTLKRCKATGTNETRKDVPQFDHLHTSLKLLLFRPLHYFTPCSTPVHPVRSANVGA